MSWGARHALVVLLTLDSLAANLKDASDALKAFEEAHDHAVVLGDKHAQVCC